VTIDVYARAPADPVSWLRGLPFDLTIDGAGVAGHPGTQVVDPATGEPLVACPEADLDLLSAAVAAAQRALPGWSALPWEDRSRKLGEFAEALVADRDALAAILTLENGKPLRLAHAEIDGAEYMIRTVAGVRLPPRTISGPPDRRIELHHRPLGVVGAIAPWNVPVGLVVVKIAAALVTGNTVVVKPSPFTPLSALRVGQIARGILPPGVVNVVAGGPELGRSIVRRPEIAKISFTGSTATGKDIARTGADTLKRLTLELGGNDAAIVLADADVAKTAQRIFATAFNSVGQFCGAVKRLYVHRDVAAQLVGALAEQVQAVRIGNGFDPASTMGPIQNRPQFERVTGLLDEALTLGGSVVTGGHRRPPGYFLSPTLVTGVAEGVRLVDEEQFGPVLPIMIFDDLEDVIGRANGTLYGLGASLWTGDLERGYRLAERLEAGSVWVNQHGAFTAAVPMPFAKESGLGIDYGEEGVTEFTQRQIVNVRLD